MRTIVDLTDDQLAALKAYCGRERVSRAEAVRRAVDALVCQDPRERRKAAIAAAFGMWKDRNIDAMDYLAELRTEWER
ncbi:MAG: ribbon-helix-helix protein, CopG family [Dehalococcoidia bacterium]